MIKAKPTLVFLVLLFSFFYAHNAFAQEVCVVMSKRIAPYLRAFEGMKEVVGRSVIKRFDLDGRRERGSEAVREIRQDGCRLVVTVGSLALETIRPQINDLPIIYTMVSNPSSLVRHAGNIAGLSIDPTPRDLIAALKRLMPNCSRIGVVYDPDHTGEYIERLEKEIESRGMTLDKHVAKNVKEAVNVAEQLVHHVDVMMMVPGPISANQTVFEFILLEGLRKGVPLVGLSRKHVKEGAIFAVTVDYRKIGIRTGELVKKVLAGMPPGSLKNTSFGRGSLVINLKMARKIGLDLNDATVREAAEVFR